MKASILIVEDEDVFRRSLGKYLRKAGYAVLEAETGERALELIGERAVEAVLLDLKLPGVDGLTVLREMKSREPTVAVIMMTAFGDIKPAVEAIKLGACHYLAKPSNTDDIEEAFQKATGDVQVALTERPTSIKTLEWERIHQTLVESDFNISETARRLGMHRRTLARKLEKRQVN